MELTLVKNRNVKISEASKRYFANRATTILHRESNHRNGWRLNETLTPKLFLLLPLLLQNIFEPYLTPLTLSLFIPRVKGIAVNKLASTNYG